MGYLLLISFIIHGITLVIIRQLKIKIDQPAVTKQTLDQQKKEIEELLAVYLLEIREENDKLLEAINHKTETKSKVNTGSIDRQVQKPILSSTQQTTSTAKPETEKYKDYQPLLPKDEEEPVETSFAAQVLALADRGYSAETIAKELNRGKTEVELLIKFHQR